MSQSIFMRGEINLSLTIACYLVGRIGSTYYIYYNPPTTDTGDQALFQSVAYAGGSAYVPRLVYIRQNADDPTTYILRGQVNNSNTINNMSVTTWTLQSGGV